MTSELFSEVGANRRIEQTFVNKKYAGFLRLSDPERWEGKDREFTMYFIIIIHSFLSPRNSNDNEYKCQCSLNPKIQWCMQMVFTIQISCLCGSALFYC